MTEAEIGLYAYTNEESTNSMLINSMITGEDGLFTFIIRVKIGLTKSISEDLYNHISAPVIPKLLSSFYSGINI